MTGTYRARANLQRSTILFISLSARLESQEPKPEAEFSPPERKIELGKNNIWRTEFSYKSEYKILAANNRLLGI